MKETAEIEINLRCTKRKEEATKFQEGEHKWLGKRESAGTQCTCLTFQNLISVLADLVCLFCFEWCFASFCFSFLILFNSHSTHLKSGK